MISLSISYFNPRSPCGERRQAGGASREYYHISIHAPRAGSDYTLSPDIWATRISIHAPRAGSDVQYLLGNGAIFGISIHAPRAGSDRKRGMERTHRNPFQSTLPVRGATVSVWYRDTSWAISIHAPRAGSDRQRRQDRDIARQFQSTLPVRGATNSTLTGERAMKNFNPRSPCGERLIN